MNTLLKTVTSPVLSLVAGSLMLGLLAIGSQVIALSLAVIAIITIIKVK